MQDLNDKIDDREIDKHTDEICRDTICDIPAGRNITLLVDDLLAIPQHFDKHDDRYGPLEGTMLPTTVNLSFICDYLGGTVYASTESLDAGRFTPDEAFQLVTAPHVKKQTEDIIAYGDKKCFSSFLHDVPGAVTFVNDSSIE